MQFLASNSFREDKVGFLAIEAGTRVTHVSPWLVLQLQELVCMVLVHACLHFLGFI